MDRYINAEEILQIAIRIEENGHSFYNGAEKSVNSPAIAKQLNALASWEDGHIAKMEELLKQYDSSEEFPMVFSPEEDTSLYLKELADDHIFVGDTDISAMVNNCKNTLEILQMALSFENDSVKFYTSLAAKVVDPDSKSVLLTIADEEQTHVTQIEKLIAEHNESFE